MDPLFINPSANDFRLQSTSPCVNGGMSSLLPPDTADLDRDGDTAEALPCDLDLAGRSSGPSVDLGALRRKAP